MSLQALLRGKDNRGCKCPVAGCPKYWTKESASVDSTFQFKMDKFFRSSQLQSQLLSENRNAEAFDIESDDE